MVVHVRNACYTRIFRRECDDLTLTMRGFAIPRSATRMKRNTMQSGHIVYSDGNDDKKKRGLLFLRSPPLSLVLSRGYALALTA